MPERDVMEPIWRNIFQNVIQDQSPKDQSKRHDLNFIWEPITIEEITATKIPNALNSGPDSIKPEDLYRLPPAYLVRIFNLILLCGKVKSDQRLARTILIPKKAMLSSLPPLPQSLPRITQHRRTQQSLVGLTR